MSPSGIPAGHRGQHGGEGADRVVAAGRQRDAAGELGDGRPVLVGHHDGGGQVVAEEQLVLAAQQVVLAVAPGRLGVGAVAGAVRRGPGEGLQVGPVHRQRRAGVLELFRDGCLQQVVAGRLQRRRGQPVGLVLAQGRGDQAEGVLGLPVSQQVRAVLPVREHAEPPLVSPRAGGPAPGAPGSGGRAGDRPGPGTCRPAGCGRSAAGGAPRRAASPRSAARRRRRR